MDEMDWYMIVLILTVLVMAVFFGWNGLHSERLSTA